MPLNNHQMLLDVQRHLVCLCSHPHNSLHVLLLQQGMVRGVKAPVCLSGKMLNLNLLRLLMMHQGCCFPPERLLLHNSLLPGYLRPCKLNTNTKHSEPLCATYSQAWCNILKRCCCFPDQCNFVVSQIFVAVSVQ